MNLKVQIRKVVGYLIVIASVIILICLTLLPIYLFKEPNHSYGGFVMLFYYVGYYGTGIFLWKRYGKRVIEFANNQKFCKL